MAAGLYSPQQSKSKYKNWLKAGLGVLITKEGITPFVEDEIKQFQQKCLSDICNTNGLPAGTTCSSCCTENVVTCPTNRICNVARGKCSYHKNAATKYIPSGCPGKICHNFKNEIQNAHRYHGPSYRNTDATQWCSNPWEVAKCFMPRDGYKNVGSAAETDFNGINSVVINLTYFQLKVNDNLSKKNNIFDQAKDVGRNVRHSPYLEVEDTDLQNYFTVLKKLLSDQGYLATNKHAQNAKQKLTKLQNDTLIFGKDEVQKVLDDVADAVQDKIRTEKDEYIKETEIQNSKLIDITKKYVEDIESRETVSISELDKALRSAVDEIGKLTSESIRKLQSEADKHLLSLDAKRDTIVEKNKEELEKLKTEADARVKNIASVTDSALKQVQVGVDKWVMKLETKADSGLGRIASETDNAVKKVEVDVDKGVEKLETETKAGIKRITLETNVAVKQVEEGVKQLEMAGDAGVKKVASETEAAVHQIRQELTTNAQEKYNKLKEELRQDLISFYTDEHSEYRTLPLEPMFEKQDTPVVNFYVMPAMNNIDIQKTAYQGEEIKNPVQSLSDMFKQGGNFSRELYLEADAGLGKTAFSKYLAAAWCQAHRPDSRYTEYFDEDVLNIMRQFEFLFLVLLRDCANVCSVDDLILKLVRNMSLYSDLEKKSLQEILHCERHLVILDGLDEWTHPETKCERSQDHIPHRNPREKCVILTTTRPWKLGVISLKTSQISKKIELVKLCSKSAKLLKERAISKMHQDVVDVKPLVEAFSTKIKESNLQDLESVPLLLIYLICLWRGKFPLGQSKYGLYTNIAKMLLSITLRKHPDLQLTRELTPHEFPQYFTEHKDFKKHYPLLTALGKLAFHTLFSETRENTLVFDSSIAEEYLSENDLKLCVKSGIITQSKVQVKLIEQSSKISFSHKSMQEYFSALYMSCQSECVVPQNCKSLQDILDMSAVFVFISRINPKMMSSISRELSSVLSKDEITTTYRSTAGYDYRYVKPLEDVQNMFISCVKENPDNNDLKLCLQDFFIDDECRQENYNTTLQSLAKHNKNNIKSVFVLNRGLSSLHKMIDSFTLTDLNNLQKLYYDGECKEEDIIRMLSESVKCVTVESSEWRDDHFIPTASSLSRTLYRRLKNLPQLDSIYINCFETSHDLLNKFLKYLMKRKSMKQIALSNLYCTDHEASCAGFKLDLTKHAGLRSLALSFVPLARLNFNISLLEECKVGRLSKPGLTSSWLSQLPAASKLNKLTCSYLQSRGDIDTMLQILPSLVHVKQVWLLYINLGESSLTLTPQMINIEYVYLGKVTMSSSSLRDLVKLVEQLPQSVTVTMVDCDITPETEFEELKQFIKTSENFVVNRDYVNEYNNKYFEFVNKKLT